MKGRPSLDDIALFIAVADAGSLAGAARATGASVPTLSRRMGALESRIGHRLFSRGSRGYALTARGAALLDEAAPVREAAARMDRLASAGGRARVRLTAGVWTAQLIARNLSRVWSPSEPWLPELVPSNAALDIARRGADIGVRNAAPAQDWLAGRRTATIRYAPFAIGDGVEGFVALSAEAPQTPSQRWLRAEHGERIVTTASDARAALDLALAGLGGIVLPLFAGAMHPELRRVGPVIDDLTHEEWLVSHHEGRRDPPVRAALDAVAALLTDRALRPEDG